MAWHWAQTLDQQQAEESNTGGFRHRHWRHHTSKAAPPQPQPVNLGQGTGGGALVNYWLRRRRECELLRGSDRSQREVEGLQQQVGLVGWPSLLVLLLSSPTSAEPLPPLHYSWKQPARPSPPSALSEGPSRHVQLKNNFATPSCAILLQNFFGTKSTHHPAGTSPTVRGRERGARWLARIVGKQVRSWSNWHGLHQLGGWTRQRLLLQAKSKKEAQQTCAAFWIQTVAI